MYDITLLCTQHEQSGNCNAAALLNIIEVIEPEVIFEELSHENFDKSYVQEILPTLETTAIKEYLKNHTILHVPVDTYPLPKNYYEDVRKVLHKLYNTNMIAESREAQALSEWYIRMSEQHGFTFLNSNQNNWYFENVDLLKETLLNKVNDENLYRIYMLEKEMIEKRECEIIKNIYNFSAVTPYNKALMMIGSGHRKSIAAVIEKFKMQESIQINWKSYFH